MTPQVRLHVERVVLHGVPSMRPEALAAAIESALAESLAGVGPPDPRPQPAGAQVARAVVPAVLGAAGIKPGGRP